ncbi:MAG: hypothetical protein R3231_03645 [bacterium]|nr:hypothetical protein [bacterium]
MIHDGVPPSFFLRKAYGAVFLSSMATVGFEVLLTRIFSIALWYHFAFMVVSIAMLGLALSGTLLAIGQVYRGKRPKLRALYPLLLALTMVAGYLMAVRIPFDPVKLSWDRLQLLLISLYYLVLSLPFVAAGFVLASALSAMGSRAGRVYGADLLGAASGAVLVIGLQAWLAPGQAVFFFAAVALGGAYLLGTHSMRVVVPVLCTCCVVVMLVNPSFIGVPMSPYKELPTLLRFQGATPLRTEWSPYGRIDLFKSPGVRYAPGLSLRYGGTLPTQLGVAIDGGAVTALTAVDPKEPVDFVKYLPGALAHELRPGANVLLINPGGGLPVLMAREYGAVILETIELNPALVSLMQRERNRGSAFYMGETGTGLARSRLASSARRYDIIDLPLTGSVAVGFLGAGEEYQLTVEAFITYLEALKGNGLLSLTAYIAPPHRGELRLMTTVLTALERLGVESPGRHVAAIRSLGVLSLLIKRTPFAPEEMADLREFAQRFWFDPVYYDGMAPGEARRHIRSRADDLADAFQALIDSNSRREFMASYIFDISPTTDERPFFHDHLKVRNLFDTYALVQGKWEFFIQEGYLVPAVLAQVVVLGFVLVVLPALTVRQSTQRGGLVILSYFALLGLAYMFIEIALIQKSILLLEHPLHAVAAVLAALLVSSGLGSLAGQRFGRTQLKIVTLVLPLCITVTAVLFPHFVTFLAGASTMVKALSLCCFLFPSGFLMGIPFPAAVRQLALREPEGIPWAWAINGFFSVVAPIVAVTVAMKIGFGGVLGAGALAYLGAFGASRGFSTLPTMGTKATGPS